MSMLLAECLTRDKGSEIISSYDGCLDMPGAAADAKELSEGKCCLRDSSPSVPSSLSHTHTSNCVFIETTLSPSL